MAAPKGNKFAAGNPGGRGPTKYKANYARLAALACRAGYIHEELAELFDVSQKTIDRWKLTHKDFASALVTGKLPPNERVVRSLYHRAVGYSHDAVKIFLGKDGKPVIVPYREHVPPDTAACRYWLTNRMPELWREQQNHTHSFVDDKRTAAELFAELQAEAVAAAGPQSTGRLPCLLRVGPVSDGDPSEESSSQTACRIQL
jgi:hypothetical protein